MTRRDATDRDDAALAPTVDSSDRALLATVAADLTSPAAQGNLTPSARYDVGEELGRGGIGRVLLAHDRQLGRDVALKELLAGSDEDGVSAFAVGRFLREARVTARLEHPGIIPVHELGRRADGSLYYTMKRVRGRSLARVLREARTLEARLATLRAFQDVCDAVAYAHSRGVVHRDLKPDNVMIGEFGETVVLDWGIAKVLGADDETPDLAAGARAGAESSLQTAEGAAMGTPSYMSPEQARGAQSEIDERSDVWGLGAILFEILTSEPPFSGRTVMEVLSKVLTDDPPKVIDREPRAPAELAAIAERALRRDRATRYRTAAELAGEVGAYLDGRAVRAYECSSIELVRRFVRRNRAATLAAFVVLVATVLASAFSFVRYREERAARGEAETARAEAERRRIEAESAESALAEESEATGRAFAQALVERAERALGDHEPIVAELFAAAALERAEAGPDDVPSIHGVVARARSVLLSAREVGRWELTEVRDLGAALPVFVPSFAVSTDGLVVARGEPTQAVFEGADASAVGETHVVALTSDGDGFIDSGPAHAVRALDGATRVPFPIEPASIRTVAAAAGHVAVAGADGTIVVFDERDGHELARIDRSASWWGLTFDASGRYLAAISRSPPRVEVRDLGAVTGAAATVVLDRPLPWPPFHVALGPSGSWVAVGGLPREVIVHSLPSGERTSIPGASTTMCIEALDAATMFVLNADGLRLVSLGAYVPALRLGVPLGRVESCRLIHRGDDLFAMLSSPNAGQAWATARWHRTTGAATSVRHVDAPILDVATADERLLLLTPNRILVWDEAGSLGSPSRTLTLPDADPPLGAAIASDGAIVVAARSGALAYAPPGSEVARTFSTPATPLGRSGALRGMAFMPDGRFVVGNQHGDLEIWDLPTRARTAHLASVHERDVYGIDVSSDGRRIATAGRDGRVCILDAASMSIEGCVEGHELLASHAAFSPDDTRLATVDGAGWVRVVDVATRETLSRRRAHSDWINRIAWSPDGELLVAGADDGASLFVADSGAPLRVLANDTTTSAVFLDGGRLACAPNGARLECVDVARARAAIDASAVRTDAERRAGVRLVGFELVPQLDATAAVR